MPRFFFQMDDGPALADSETAELADLTAARDTALGFIGQNLVDRSIDFWSRGEFRLTVSDENRLTLFVIQVVATDAPSVHVAIIPDTVN